MSLSSLTIPLDGPPPRSVTVYYVVTTRDEKWSKSRGWSRMLGGEERHNPLDYLFGFGVGPLIPCRLGAPVTIDGG